jgi:2-iminoacetate synthase ThiH
VEALSSDVSRDTTRGLSRADVDHLLASSDLLKLGQMADAAKRERHGDRASYVTVFEIRVDSDEPRALEIPIAAREIRLVGLPRSIDDAEAAVVAAKAVAGDRTVTGFTLADLVSLSAHSGLRLTEMASRLASAGLESLAEVPIDLLVDPLRAVGDVIAGGLFAWRAVLHRAPWHERLTLIDRVCELQSATGAVKAFAPLPRVDDRAAPSTGFDDVRTVAAARLMCAAVPHIQVDWPLYGPKLAQVALTYGADDIDGVSAVDALGLGWRRAPVEDVERNIRAAGHEPVLRSGRFTFK